MDEYSQSGFEPELKKYFGKITRSVIYTFLIVFPALMAGIYFGLAFPQNGLKWYNFLYYFLFLAGLGLLIRFLYKTWKNG